MTTIPAQAADPTTETGPTQVDAQLMLQLSSLATSPAMDRGQGLLHAHRDAGGMTWEQFRALDPRSEDVAGVLAVMRWHETVGTLVRQGLLDRGLVLDWLWVRGSWDLCRQIALGMREHEGVPELWENFEALAASQTR